jgi:hypothetical protein
MTVKMTEQLVRPVDEVNDQFFTPDNRHAGWKLRKAHGRQRHGTTPKAMHLVPTFGLRLPGI